MGTFTPALTPALTWPSPTTEPTCRRPCRRSGKSATPPLEHAVNRAFPGSHVEIDSTAGRFELHQHQPGLLRPLTAAELSEGTLRYLLLVAALLTPRPPELIVINEPETSLHPDLLPALAELMVTAAGTAQIVLVGQRMLDEPSWHWPSR